MLRSTRLSNLPQSANATNVKIYDANGNLVRTLKNTGSNPGDTTVTWDGKDDNGNVVATGKMKFVVESTDDKGQTVQVQQFLVGTVTGVRFRSDGTVFIIDGVEVPLSQVLEIMEG